MICFVRVRFQNITSETYDIPDLQTQRLQRLQKRTSNNWRLCQKKKTPEGQTQRPGNLREKSKLKIKLKRINKTLDKRHIFVTHAYIFGKILMPNIWIRCSF